MNGERALIYSRIRENMLDPSETDVTRGARQQAVMNAVAHEVHVARRPASRCRSTGGSFAKPLDDRPDARRSSSQLGWVKFRASDAGSVHCRLGGDLGGGGTGSPSEDNPATIAMFLGRSAPQPPTDPFGPGCVTGHALSSAAARRLTSAYCFPSAYVPSLTPTHPGNRPQFAPNTSRWVT